ncbi:MAG: RidA family protein [Mogibacterium sp.]|nr:RidA family protein [Mogibacterium sp.]
MHEIDKRLEELGIVLEVGPKPIANYVSVQKAGDIWFFSGSGPFKDGKPAIFGRLGDDMTVEEGYAAARLTGINMLAIMKREFDGDWDKLEQVVKVNGYVRCTDDFGQQPAVINGVSDLFVEVLGDKGRHARTAMGTNALPMDMPMEVEWIIKVK